MLHDLIGSDLFVDPDVAVSYCFPLRFYILIDNNNNNNNNTINSQYYIHNHNNRNNNKNYRGTTLSVFVTLCKISRVSYVDCVLATSTKT